MKATQTDLLDMMKSGTPEERLDGLFEMNFKELLRLPEFRMFLLYVVDHPDLCAVASDAADSSNTNETFRMLGRQRVGKLLFQRSMRLDREMHLRMTSEAITLREKLAAKKD